jgi:hypothetical protein
MSVVGTVAVTCPACGAKQEVRLVQSINARTEPAAKARLVAGELNLLRCGCGKVAQLAASVMFHDPDAGFYARVVPEGGAGGAPDGGDAAMRAAADLFHASGAIGRLRLVRSLPALVEKVKLLDAGLEDWAIEITKVLLLSTIGDVNRILLFDRLDPEAGRLHWLLFDEQARAPRALASPLPPYQRIADRAASAPAEDELEIDRAWAVGAAQALIASIN